jgi:hypothetical protein
MIFTSATRHCAPSAAEPGAVIRSTTCDGGIEGGMIGAGRGGACATEIDATANTTTTKAAPVASLARFVVRIFGVLLFPNSFEEFLKTEPLICPKCQGKIRIISFIAPADVIKNSSRLRSMGRIPSPS